MIGRRLGSYEITSKLGEGGMGEVYRATDTKLRREVAIKVLPAAFTENMERLARFEREAQLLAQLNHPSIAQVDVEDKCLGALRLACIHALAQGTILLGRGLVVVGALRLACIHALAQGTMSEGA